ncbi:amidohydrolase family protein [Spongiimicrobium sp. 2-473A-2-J]|uniref:amidohydrolase family protein n=1 Tax=Eudoraea algarum TaxID=3417568 RepID=UPI003D35AA2D
MIRNCAYLLLLLGMLGCTPKEKLHYDIVISGAQVLNFDSGDFISATVFIQEGSIAKLSEDPQEGSYTADTEIDGSGKFLLPGFWDNHVHFRGGDSLIPANKNFLKLFIANGITTVRDAGGDLALPVLEWKKKIADGQLVGPTIFTAGPKIDGPNPTWAGSLEVASEAEVVQALDSLVQLGVDFVKLYDSRIAGEYHTKAIREAKSRGFAVSGHASFEVPLNETVAAGIDAVEHLYDILKACSHKEREVVQQLRNKELGFWEAMPVLLESYSDSTAQNTFDLLRQENVFVVPTLHIGETLSYLDEVDHSKDPYLKYMGKGIEATYQGRIQRALQASEATRTNRKQLDRFFRQLAKSLQEAEVKLLAGSDSGAYNSYTYPGISLHKELEAMVAVGIPPLEVLKTSAYHGAQFLQQDDEYGSIALGKVADLVLLDANPLEDITHTQDIHTVIKGSRVFNTAALQQLLEDALQNPSP